jgi:hypothetical protein
LGLVPAWAQNELKGLSGVNVGVLLDESVKNNILIYSRRFSGMSKLSCESLGWKCFPPLIS